MILLIITQILTHANNNYNTAIQSKKKCFGKKLKIIKGLFFTQSSSNFYSAFDDVIIFKNLIKFQQHFISTIGL